METQKAMSADNTVASESTDFETRQQKITDIEPEDPPVGHNGEVPWKNPHLLSMLYYGTPGDDGFTGLTQKEIAEIFTEDKYDRSCSDWTISNYMQKHGIDPSTVKDRGYGGERVPYAKFRTSEDGYERWRTASGSDSINVHRLCLIAWNQDQSVESLLNQDTHHLNGCSFDNRESNLIPETHRAHASHECRDQPRNDQGEFVRSRA
jgi:hypothetical protein